MCFRDAQCVTSHQRHPGEPDLTEDALTPRGEDLAALLHRLLGETDGKSQKDLAAAAGISYQTLNAWMNRTRGTSRIEPDRLRALAATFRTWGVDISPSHLFKAVGRPVPGPSDAEREAHLLSLYRQLPAEKQRALIEDARAMLKVVSATRG